MKTRGLQAKEPGQGQRWKSSC